MLFSKVDPEEISRRVILSPSTKRAVIVPDPALTGPRGHGDTRRPDMNNSSKNLVKIWWWRLP